MKILIVNHFVLITFLICLFLFIAQPAGAVTETSRQDYKIADGVYESTIYADDSKGNNLCLHVLKMNKDADCFFKAGYGKYYKKDSTAEQRKEMANNWNRNDWNCEEMLTQLDEFNSIRDNPGELVAAFNADHFDMNGKTLGNLVIEGNKVRQSNAEPYFAVLKDGSVDIRTARESLDNNVTEAVGGSYILVSGGKIIVAAGDYKEPRMALGLDDEKNVIIVAVEGRSPFSAGATLYETAQIMKQQGCREAINLDGGGSSSFITKRSGEDALKHRNRLLESRRRNIASTLYVIDPLKTRAGNGKAVSDRASEKTTDGSIKKGIEKSKAAKTMKDRPDNFSALRNSNRIRGFCMMNGKPYCFAGKKKGYTGTVKIGHYEYTFENGSLNRSSDPDAGEICIGYCGSTGQENSVLFVYHGKDRVLNIGSNPFTNIAGEMKNWDRVVSVPWHSVKNGISKVFIEGNIKNIGDRFLCFPRTKNYDGRPLPGASIDELHITGSVRNIGCRAFYNAGVISHVDSPRYFDKIGEKALEHSNLRQFMKRKK